jgi:hypothetical protein
VTRSYANPGAEPARFSLAVFEPGVKAVFSHPTDTDRKGPDQGDIDQKDTDAGA